MKISADLASEQKANAKEFSRWAIAVAMGRNEPGAAVKFWESRWPKSKMMDAVRRQAIPAMGTDNNTSPLAGLNVLADAFIATLRPQSIVGRMQGLRRVPFNVRIARTSSGSTAGWVGEARIKSASQLSLDKIELGVSKIASLIVVSTELARMSDPAAERLLIDDLSAAVVAFEDASFVDPSLAATDVSPGSIYNGTTELTTSGSSYAALSDDIRRLVALVAAGSSFASPYFTMTPAVAAGLAALDSGGGIFRDASPLGGQILGIPVLTSTAIPADSNSPTNSVVGLVDASEILIAEGPIRVTAANNSIVQMDTAPDSPPTSATTVISLWQHDLSGLLAEREVNWKRRRDSSAAYLSGIPF